MIPIFEVGRREAAIEELKYLAYRCNQIAINLDAKDVSIYATPALMPDDDYISLRIGNKKYWKTGESGWKEEEL